MRDAYLATARALVAAAPHVFWDDTFALKGGTAINLFMRDMPRLSVDLDLVFAALFEQRDQRDRVELRPVRHAQAVITVPTQSPNPIRRAPCLSQ